jgi:hypothetical protein
MGYGWLGADCVHFWGVPGHVKVLLEDEKRGAG